MASEDYLIRSLASSSSDVVYKALLELRGKYIKQTNKAGTKRFREKGGLKLLMRLIQKPSTKIVDIALSILGNCCLEEETRKEVLRLDGICAIATVLKCLEAESIQARACRTLANLSLDPEIATAIHKEDIPALIIKFLSSTENSASQQTAVRALRILSETPRHRDQVVQLDGVRCTAELLTCEDEALLHCAVRAMAQFTRQCSHECAQQVQAGGGVQALVALASHTSDVICNSAVTVLINLAHQPSIRPVIGNMGAIKVFINVTDSKLSSSLGMTPIATALCLCCREAINRVRIRENGGLKTLLALLENDEHERIHAQVISSLLNFLYDDPSLNVLVELGLIPTLVKKLSKLVEAHSNEHERSWKYYQDKLTVAEPDNENGFKLQDSQTSEVTASCTSPRNKARRWSTGMASKRTTSSVLHTGSPKLTRNSDQLDKCMTSTSKAEGSAIGECKQQMYRINSPSYREVQNELMMSALFRDEMSSNADDSCRWSPTSTMYSPGHSPPVPVSPVMWAMPSTSSGSLSPGAVSPDRLLSGEQSPFQDAQQSPFQDDQQSPLHRFSTSASCSPMSISPAASPAPNYACYSPICEEYSEEEDNVQLQFFEASALDRKSQPDVSDNKHTDSVNVMQLDNLNDNEAAIDLCDELNDSQDGSPDCSSSSGVVSDAVSRVELEGTIFSFSDDLGSADLPLPPKAPRSRSQSFMSESPSQNLSLVVETQTQTWWWHDFDVDPLPICHLLMLLSRFSQMEKPNASILTPTCIDALFAALTLSPRPVPRAARILNRLARNPLCLESLLNLRLPQQVVRKLETPTHPSTLCCVCDALQTLAHSLMASLSMQTEAPFGLGVVAHMLIAGTAGEKNSSALMVPYLVRAKQIRQKILLEYGALDVVLGLLENPQNSDFVSAVESIIVLCKEISITAPRYLPAVHNAPSDESSCIYELNPGEKDVMFLLDDGTTISASKSLLIEKSAVFNAMLQGEFSESQQDQIKIGDVSKDAFSYTMHFLYGCKSVSEKQNKNLLETRLVDCPVHSADIETLLEVTTLADRLLLNEMQEHAQRVIMAYFLQPNNASHVYSIARSHNCRHLSTSVLRHVLSPLTKSEEKVTFMNDLLKSPLSKAVVVDMKLLIKQHL